MALRAQVWGGEAKSHASIGMRLPEAMGAGVQSLDPRVFPFEQKLYRGLSAQGEISPFLDWRPLSLKRRTELDSTGKFIVVAEEMNGLPVRPPYVVPIKDYLSSRLGYEQALAWHKAAAGSIYETDDDQRRGAGGVNIEIPVPIKSKAFAQIFGGSTVGLNVQGDISIKGGFRRETRSEVKTAFTRGSDFSFKMNQTQRFTVTGRIGEKVSVNVDQDSERAFDFENNIRLNYTGFEDDIVQKIEAGNVALSLPGTRFVTFGGTSAGLFGIKSEMQLGNLSLTTIASQEKGENKRLTLSGGATEGVQKIQDSDYRRFTYFFLDTLYREQFRHYSDKWTHTYDPLRVVTDIVVYKSGPGYDVKSESIPGIAFPAMVKDSTEIYRGHFIRLEPNTNYYIQKDLGYLIMNDPLGDEEVLAVAFKTINGDTVGNVDYVADPDPLKRTSISLRLIKPKSPTPSQSTWNLEWKNVYSLGSRNIPREGFELKIFFKTASGDPQETLAGPNGTVSYLNVFGLDERDNTGALVPDNLIDFNEVIINLARGELIFPDLRPFDPVGVFIKGKEQKSILPPEKRTTRMYDTKIRTEIDADSKFYLEVKSKTRSSNYSLGFNVIENSEKVLLNGVELRRDTDYIIDYFSGNLTILREDATKPNAQVEISYQGNALFQMEKKTMVGTRAEYRFNPNSFIGGTLMYLNQRTLDTRVRLGSIDSGPMRNLVWDVNAAFRFQPNFLSRALNALPVLSTQEPSDLRIEGEIAQIVPNPNTLNSTLPGDEQGVAYVDDFEASKRTTPLGVMRRGWVQASIPVELLNEQDPKTRDAANSQERKVRTALSKRGSLIWFNPYNGVRTTDIYPNRDVNVTNQTTQVLTLLFTPVDTVGIAKNDSLGRSWNGIMRALSPGFYDQTESKFLEIWFQGTKGRLHIDLGQITEDIIPNGRLNTEDTKDNIRNNILDEGEDIGLDGVRGQDPSDYWDLNNNGRQNWGEPASNDDWSYSSGSSNYERVNGTENSKNDASEGGGTIRPDTEDINANGGLDLADNYFSFSFDLDPTSADTSFKDGGKLSGWKLYRIPLQDAELINSGHRRDVGKPDLTRIEYVRLWLDGVHTPGTAVISIADISFAGNEWKEVGIGKSETHLKSYQPDPRFEVTVVNNEENLDYRPPPGFKQEQDKISLLRLKEQSQVLRVKDLQQNEIAVAQKTFFQPMNFINYNRLKMFVFGKDDRGTHINDAHSKVEFFIRFGADTSNFYEFRELVYPGWDSVANRNKMDISLIELTDFKNKPDTTNKVPGVGNPVYYFQKIFDSRRPGAIQELRVRGNPSLTNIRTLVAGIKNLSTEPFSGEIWMDELRVTEVKKDKGIALRMRADLKLADFMTINGEVNRQDADFHNVAERFGRGDNRTSYTLASSITLDKLLPQSWGLSIPVSMNYIHSLATPKYKPGTDILVTGSFTEKDLSEIRSLNDQAGFNFSIRRRARSRNFFIKNTIDNLSGSLSYTKSRASSSQIVKSERTAWSGDLSYNLTFGSKNYIQPFTWIGKAPLLGKLTNTKLYYTPQNFSAQMQASMSKDSLVTRLSNGARGLPSGPSTYNAVYNFRTSMKLVDNLSFDFSKGYTDDWRKAKNQGLVGLFFGNHDNLGVNQSFGAKYSPNLFSWFNPNFNYTSSYRYTNNITQGNTGRGAGTNTSFTANTSLRFAELFRIFKRKAAPAGGDTSGRTRQAPRLPPGQPTKPEMRPGEEEELGREPEIKPPQRQLSDERTAPEQKAQEDKKKKEKKQKDEQPGRGISLSAVADFFGKFKDININYSRRDNYSDYALEKGVPQWRYQFGFSRNPGVDKMPGITTTPSSYQRGENYSLSSGLDLSRNFNITLRFDHDQQRNQSTTTTGTTSDSWMRLGVLGNEGIPFPEWTVTWSGLERIKIFGKFASSMSISHGFGGKKSSVWNGAPDRITSEDFSFNFRPLIKINLSWKNGMVSSFQYNKTTGERPTYNPFDERNPLPKQDREQGASLTRNTDISFTTTYSKQSGFRLPLPFLKNKELRNSVDFSMTFLRSSSESALRRGNTKDVSSNSTRRWSFSPRMNYSFSNRVRGGAYFEIGKTDSKLSGTTNIKELGIDVNISIRGE
ncbi:MAG: cell surface protein SprA [candidate division KSB1 bacterium]|nr:cell surface protein SprA [candidate division KSB1 bacterium]MDZ7303920.1 cell surface protein SprA [candidate division KSB1 bacterium]MDZ7313081.1 cell surface protein SprA [candidate division KSB1 bacterium]